MKTLSFSPDELQALLDILAPIISHTTECGLKEDPDYFKTHVFNFSHDQFQHLKNMGTEITEFLNEQIIKST